MLCYYHASIYDFLSDETVLQQLAQNSEFDITLTQRKAWQEEISIMKDALNRISGGDGFGCRGQIIFEYNIPRLGKRVDVILLLDGVIFTIEFKAGEVSFNRADVEQVWDYALDLKNFHEASHDKTIVPILVATEAKHSSFNWHPSAYNDEVYEPLLTNAALLTDLLTVVSIAARPNILRDSNSDPDDSRWLYSRYAPTPTIIQAASYMYTHHSVEEITKHESDKTDLKSTTAYLVDVIAKTKERGEKAICFVTGVPGAGKTLVGLNVAIHQFEQSEKGTPEMAVYLSGNGPLVDVLTEALARDKKRQSAEEGKRINITDARREVKSFIQIIHHYRNDYLNVLKTTDTGLAMQGDLLLVDESKYRKLGTEKFEGVENVAIFDEAQRAWTKEQLSSWLNRKKGIPGFPYSEPEFLIWSLNLRQDWAVIVCLVGGGQEINTGEAGISEWINAVNGKFKNWKVYISPNLTDKEYDEGRVEERLQCNPNVTVDKRLHLSVNKRSFRAESLSRLVHDILEMDSDSARANYAEIKDRYPIVLTRSLDRAKDWLKVHARGSERMGIVCSSQAYRLKPLAIDVRVNPDHVHWFLDDENDIRSSQFLEDVCTEFQVQGLELDWTCVMWDADFRYNAKGWEHREFLSSRWNNINKPERQLYQTNAYRVLLTRARQGMIICIPEGNPDDATRRPEFYDPTFLFLKSIGFKEI